MLARAAATWGAILVAGVVAWRAVPAGTNPSLLKAGLLRRAGRGSRAIWTRWLLWWASWPHLIDRLSGVHRASVEQSAFDVVWREGPVTLRRLRGKRAGTPILLVHALVSQPWILDLAPGHSLVEALVEAGFDVYVLDWGSAGKAEARRGFADYVSTLLCAEDRVLEGSGSERLHLAGYCSGGTLCLIRLAGWSTERVASFAAIAPPVDLAVPGGMSAMMTRSWLKPVLMLDGDGCVPAALIRESFHALRPEALRTVTRAIRRRRDPVYRRIYDPLSRWAYEQRRIPGALLFDTVDLHRSNALFDGGLSIADRRIDLSDIETPVLVAMALRDHIVPAASSLALASVLDIETLICRSGHVSLLSGERGREELWPRLTAFFNGHGHPRRKRSASSTRVDGVGPGRKPARTREPRPPKLG